MENFCKPGLMSTCTAKTQKKCEFFKKSSQNSEKCMYFIFGEYCDCLKAQVALQGKANKNEKKKEESKGKDSSPKNEEVKELRQAYMKNVRAAKIKGSYNE